MNSSKIYFLLHVVFIIISLQGLVEGRSLSHTEEVKLHRNQVMNVLQSAIIEFGYRVGALKLPEVRGGTKDESEDLTRPVTRPEIRQISRQRQDQLEDQRQDKLT